MPARRPGHRPNLNADEIVPGPPLRASGYPRGMSKKPLPASELKRARRVAHVLDDLIPIPGTGWRIGIDPLLGLLPGAGDWMGWAASLHLMVTAVRAGADAWTLTRMAGNLVLDAVVGVVPLFGDLFDMAWKANDRNLRLLEELVADPAATRSASRLAVGLVFGGTLAALSGAAWGAYWLVRTLVLWLAGVA